MTVCVQFFSAQDYKATAEALEYQLQIMQLQKTIDAMGGNSDSSGNNNSTDMYVWNQENSGYSSTPTPFNYSYSYPNTTISSSNFPFQVRPPVPSGPPPTWQKPEDRYSTAIYVGDAGQYLTISEAMKHLLVRAGEVTIYLVSDTEELRAGISIPMNKKISSVRIVANDERSRRTIWPADRSVWFFCNGIPLLVDKAITFAEKSMIMGGFVTYSGDNVEAPKSTIVINGNAHWVYADGRSIWGETFVHNSTVVVNGTANEIYCGRYTENASAKATVGQANLKVYGWYSKFGLGLGAGQSYLLTPVGCYQ